MNRQKIIIDTDLGNDDIMAIAMLLLSSDVEIQAISLVNGVSRIEKSIKNINSILKYLKAEIPVFVNKNLVKYPYKVNFPERDIERAENLTLLKELKLPKVDSSSSDLDILLDNIEETVLLAIGPLTNIAYLIKSNPKKFKEKVKKIIIMGGGISKGNVPPLRVAEYNFALDPQAAKYVLDSEIPKILIDIDATSQVPCTNEFKELVRSIPARSKPAEILKEIILNNEKDFDDFYDPLAASALIDPKIISQMNRSCLTVITTGKELGRTVESKTKDATIFYGSKINSKRFYKLLISLIEEGK